MTEEELALIFRANQAAVYNLLSEWSLSAHVLVRNNKDNGKLLGRITLYTLSELQKLLQANTGKP